MRRNGHAPYALKNIAIAMPLDEIIPIRHSIIIMPPLHDSLCWRLGGGRRELAERSALRYALIDEANERRENATEVIWMAFAESSFIMMLSWSTICGAASRKDSIRWRNAASRVSIRPSSFPPCRFWTNRLRRERKRGPRRKRCHTFAWVVMRMTGSLRGPRRTSMTTEIEKMLCLYWEVFFQCNVLKDASLQYKCLMHPYNTMIWAKRCIPPIQMSNILRDASLQYKGLLYWEMHPSNTMWALS